MSKVYLASRYSRNPEMRDVRDRLAVEGHTVTSRWIDLHAGQLEESFTPERLAAEPEFCSTFAQADVDDLLSADVVVSYTGAGGKGGRHVEFGLALGLNRPCVIVGPRENVFHCLPQVEVVDDTDELVAWLSCNVYI